MDLKPTSLVKVGHSVGGLLEQKKKDLNLWMTLPLFTWDCRIGCQEKMLKITLFMEEGFIYGYLIVESFE